MKLEGVEHQAALAQLRHAFAEIRIGVETARRCPEEQPCRGIFQARAALANAAHAPLSGSFVSIEHGGDIGQSQVGMHHQCGDPRGASDGGGAIGKLGGKFRFADRTKVLRPVRPVCRSTFDIDAAGHVVTASAIAKELLEEVAAGLQRDARVLRIRHIALVPQVAVRVDDFPVGFEDGLMAAIPPFGSCPHGSDPGHPLLRSHCVAPRRCAPPFRKRPDIAASRAAAPLRQTINSIGLLPVVIFHNVSVLES